MEKTKDDYEMELYNIVAQENSDTIYNYIIEHWTPKAIQMQALVSPKTADDGNKIRWFMELALKMRETGYSDASIYSIDTDAWDEYRVDDELTPEQAIIEEESNG